jgi:hypothetical protein
MAAKLKIEKRGDEILMGNNSKMGNGIYFKIAG